MQRRAYSAFDALAARRLGVNTTDLHCLNILESRSGLTAGELALEAGLTSGAVTGVVDRLERAGYARRTADPRFQRSDRLRFEHATTLSEPPKARLLDRNGNPLSVPVQVTERPDESGAFRWIVVDAALAPFAPGDYAVEVTQGTAKQVTAFRIVP